MLKVWILTSLLLVAPTVAGGGPYAGCTIKTSPAVEVVPGTMYFSMSYVQVPGMTDAEFWLEDNGVPGLQKGDTFCADGRVIPRDHPVISEFVKDPTRLP